MRYSWAMKEGMEVAAIGELIADRYHVESELGRGGMAVAYAVRDTLRGGTLALKRLLPEATDAGNEISQLFEQEFHTLQQLSHPRVVAVYDFGYDGNGRAFYTMEWLGGDDLRAQSPMPYQRVCALLCDITSALSLLHSRRLVHRDVTPHNVRCTADGLAKLIDFGAIAPFGVARRLVGTPPFCPPEAVHGQDLDGRADLFALGATAYYGLTGRHAFPGRSLAAVQTLWRSRLRPPSSYSEDIPPALDALVLSLLSLDRAARPTTAAEVMERLAVIGSVDLSEQLVVQQAYLTSPGLVGRDEELLRVRKLVTRGLRRQGGSTVIEGAPQMGRSRFLSSCVLEAKLHGAVVAQADATDAAGPFGVAMALATQVLEAMPALAAGLDDRHRDLLGVGERRGGDVLDLDVESQAKLQVALRDLMLRASATRSLMLAVDDADRIDERSAALLGLLSTEARQNGIVLIATVLAGSREADNPSLRFFADAASTIKIRPLSQEQTRALLRSIFGEVAHLGALAKHLHRIAAGSPGALMQLAQHLLDRGLVGYEAGAWALPPHLDPNDLPASVQAALEAKLQRLEPAQLTLAQGLSLVPREGLSLDDLKLLLGSTDAREVLGAAEKLSTLGITRATGVVYRLANDAYRPLLAASMPSGQTRSLHDRLATIFCKRPGRSWAQHEHLQLAGREQEAVELMLPGSRDRGSLKHEQVTATVRQLPEGWQTHVRALIAHCERVGRPREEAHLLRATLVGFAALTSQAEKGDLEILLRQLEHDSGHDIYMGLNDSLPPAERLMKALSLAQERFDNTVPELRVMPPGDALPLLARTVIGAIGILGPRYDHAFFRNLTSLQPYVSLSPALQVSQWNVEGTTALASGHYHILLERNSAILERMAEPDLAGLDPISHRYMGLALRYSGNLVCTMFGRQLDDAHLADMDADPVFAISACHLRMLGALCIGDITRADHHRREAELIRLQDNPAQMFEGVYVAREFVVYAFAGDLARLKQLIPAIEHRASSVAGWQPLLHQARGCYHELRGALDEALADFEAGLALTEAGTHMAHAPLAACRLLALIQLGRAEEALDPGGEYLAAARAVELGPQLHLLLEAMARVQAAVGAHAQASRLSDEAITVLEDFEAGGLVLGGAYETRARVALDAGDQESFERYAKKCAGIYRSGRNPLLTARYASLMTHAEAVRIAVSEELATAAEASIAKVTEMLSLSQCVDSAARARTALQSVLEASESDDGFVYTVQAQGAILAAQVGTTAPPAGLDELVAKFLQLELETEMEAEVTMTSATATDALDLDELSGHWRNPSGVAFTARRLEHVTGRGREVTGVAVIRGGAELRIPSSRLLAAISQALHQSGDVATMVAGL